MSDAHSLPLTQLKTQQDQPARNYEENKVTIQPNPDNVGPEAYARRIEAGDQILYIKEAAAFVRKVCGHDALFPAPRHRTPQLPPRTQRRLLEERPHPLARRGEQSTLRS
jgi:hypothetical protein